MRSIVLGLAMVAAMTGIAEARDCSGQGSAGVVSIEQWLLLGGGQVEVSYHLHNDKPATRLGGHVYFQIVPDDVLADAAIALDNPAGIAERGTSTMELGKDATHRLMAAVSGTVDVLVCTYTVEYLDGSGGIID
ncbi:MAG: hypothetical protein ACOH2M_26795 [Cypionkella sp.]